MADPELMQVRAPEVLTLTVIRARDLFQRSPIYLTTQSQAATIPSLGGARAPSVVLGGPMPPPTLRGPSITGGGAGGLPPSAMPNRRYENRVVSPVPVGMIRHLPSAMGGSTSRGQRGEVVTSLVKVEYGEKVLGESSKEDCAPSQPAEFNYNTSLNVTFEDPLTLDELATKPIVLTFIEVLPKEKKQKEEKTVILGQCSLDLMPLVQGELMHKTTLLVNPVPGSPLDALTPDQPRPEVDVCVCVESALLTDAQLKECNLMALTVESAYSPPDAFMLTGVQYLYTATLPMPVTSEKENIIVYAGGQLKPSVDKEIPGRQKRWAVPGGALGNAVFIQDRNLAIDPIEEEDGDYKGKDDREHRTTSEQDKNRVTWNIERRCFMDGSGSKSFQDKIAKTRYWPVEIYRTALPSGGKGKKEDEGHISFHGIAYVNLAPLLYPGVKRIRGAYKVVAYSDQELTEKTARKGGLAEEAMKIANGILSRSSSSPFPKPGKGSKDDAKAKDTKKGLDSFRSGTAMRIARDVDKAALRLQSAMKGRQPQEGEKGKGKDKSDKDKDKEPKASDIVSEADGGQVVNAEGQLYVESRSYIMLEFSLQRPLVPKRQSEELSKRVADYIPPRPLFPKRTDGAQRAVDDYHGQVASVASLILDEFRERFGESLVMGSASSSCQAMEERRQKLIYELTSSGKYFSFKEQLKHAVVKIVREKYLKTGNFKMKEDLQTFLSELYVYLVDQMHVGLNKVLAIEDQSPVPEPLTDSAQLKHFAREAEVNKNFELAAKYYQERIARDRKDPDHWLDYGTFCLYINDYTKAEECFKECVSIDQRHIAGLLLYGVVCTMQDKNEVAETFFEAATSFEPKSILAWTTLGLFYNSIGNEIGTEMALLEGDKLNMAAATAVARAAREQEQRELREQRDRERMAIQQYQQQVQQAQEAAVAAEQAATVMAATETDIPAAADAEMGLSDGASKDGTTPGDMSAAKATAVTPTSQAGSDKKGKVRGGSAIRGKSVLEPTAEVVEPQNLMAAKLEKPVLDPQGDKGQMGNRVRSNDNLASQPSSVYNPATGEEDTEGDNLPPRESTPVPTTTIYMQAIDFLLEVKALPFAERALAHHLLDPLGGRSAAYFVARARLELQKQQLEDAELSLKEALQFDHQHPDAWAILGHVKFLLGDTEVAKDCYERTLSFIADASEMHSIYLRLASIYLQEAQFDKAQKQFLMACRRSPSCVSWLGVGIACYRSFLPDQSLGAQDKGEAGRANVVLQHRGLLPRLKLQSSFNCTQLGDLADAEDALSEANILNNTDPEVWGYLSLVCLRTGRQLEAEQAYKHAIKLNLGEQQLLDEIHSVQEEVGFGNPQL